MHDAARHRWDSTGGPARADDGGSAGRAGAGGEPRVRQAGGARGRRRVDADRGAGAAGGADSGMVGARGRRRIGADRGTIDVDADSGIVGVGCGHIANGASPDARGGAIGVQASTARCGSERGVTCDWSQRKTSTHAQATAVRDHARRATNDGTTPRVLGASLVTAGDGDGMHHTTRSTRRGKIEHSARTYASASGRVHIQASRADA